MDRQRETPPTDPVVQTARPRAQFGRLRTGAAPKPRAELEPVTLGPQPKSAWARVLRNVLLVSAAAVTILALKLAIPALARELPGCASTQVRDILVTTMRRELSAKNFAYTRIDVADARRIPTDDGRLVCRAQLRVDAKSVPIEYDISWSNWLLGRFRIDARPARN